MPDLELQVEGEVVALAERAGWVVRKAAWQGRRGAPDRVFFGFGRAVFIEFKRPKRTTEGQQRREVERLRAAYPDVHVCDSVDAALRVLGIER